MRSQTKKDSPRAKPLRGRKTWAEKLQDDKDLPKVVPMPQRGPHAAPAGTMLVPAPREVDALMRRVPRGRLTTMEDLRAALARRHGATTTCPITTGIFAWMAAQAAEEASAQKKTGINPYWRTLKSGGELNPKYPGGIPAITARLEAEGHEIFQKGRRAYVASFEKKLVPSAIFS